MGVTSAVGFVLMHVQMVHTQIISDRDIVLAAMSYVPPVLAPVIQNACPVDMCS